MRLRWKPSFLDRRRTGDADVAVLAISRGVRHIERHGLVAAAGEDRVITAAAPTSVSRPSTRIADGVAEVYLSIPAKLDARVQRLAARYGIEPAEIVQLAANHGLLELERAPVRAFINEVTHRIMEGR